MTKRLKKWPYWTRTNTGLFIGGLVLYCGLFGLLCQGHPRVVFMILSIVAAASTFTVLWTVINHKDKNEN